MSFDALGVGQASGRNDRSAALDQLQIGSGVDRSRHNQTHMGSGLPQHLSHLIGAHPTQIDLVNLEDVVTALQTIVL